jgi:hypothetical protein
VFTVRCEDAMESGQINPWFRHQGNQPGNKIQRLKKDAGECMAAKQQLIDAEGSDIKDIAYKVQVLCGH